MKSTITLTGSERQYLTNHVAFAQAPSNYKWVIEADIEACFDRLAHAQILGEVRRRVGDKRVLELARAFLKAGVMTETGRLERTVTGTPQGGIISPLLANIALSALDRTYEADWQEISRYTGRRQYLRSRGHATHRLVRFGDDLVIMVKGTETQAQALLVELRDAGRRLIGTTRRFAARASGQRGRLGARIGWRSHARETSADGRRA